MACDRAVAVEPLVTGAPGPVAAAQVIQEHLNVYERRALVKVAGQLKEFRLGIDAERLVGERIPSRVQEIMKLMLSTLGPPSTPISE